VATMRIGEKTRAVVKELAQQRGVAMQEIIDEAVELYRRRQILEAGNAAYAALRADPDEWQEYVSECEEWDVTLMDGLEGL
jgi:hypothetical protein